jgi:DNA-binding transcriptional ArsR family regulator
MAGKKSKSDIEGVRTELRTLSEAVWALRNQVSFEAAAAAANGHRETGATPSPARDLEGGQGRGTVHTRGVVRSAQDELEVSWESEVDADSVLAEETEGPARILAAIGQPQRLAIVKLLLDGPTTAATLVSSLELGTTGAAYHHLNVLQSAGLVAQASRGVFELSPERAGAVLTILAGLKATSVVTTTDDELAEPTGKKRRKKSA